MPDDAFDDGETLIVDYDVDPNLPDGYTSIGSPFDIYSTSGDQPSTPVTLVVPYDPTGTPDGVHLDELYGVSTLNETTELWEPLDVDFDTTANTLSATVDTFSLKWPWEWDWAGMAAEVSDDLGKLVGVRAGGVECTRGTEPPDWFNTTSFSNNAGDAIRACVEAETKKADVLVIELQNNRSGGQWITWDIPRVGTQGAQQSTKAIAWLWSDLGEARKGAESWLSRQIGTKGLYLPPLGRATIAMREDDWYLATFAVPDPGDVKPTIAIDALLTTIDVALGKAIASGTGSAARKLQLRDAALTWAFVECKAIISPWNAIKAPSGADLLHAAGDCLVGIEKAAVYSRLMNVEELAKFSAAAKALSTAVTIGTYVGKAGVYVADMTLFNKWEPKEYTVLARSTATSAPPLVTADGTYDMPKVCDLRAAIWVDGAHPDSNSDIGLGIVKASAVGDINGDDAPDTVIATMCTFGGNMELYGLHAFDSTGKYLGPLPAYDSVPTDEALGYITLETITPAGEIDATIDWFAAEDPDCCPSNSTKVTFTWNGTGFDYENAN